MGSESDSAIMQKAKDTLDQFGIPSEIKVMSAHRTPDLVHQYAFSAQERGIEVIITGAGKAAHLAGAVASRTTLPVIGIPIKTAGLGGLDALLSTVQMPSGVPVATVAIDSAHNAAILAAQILAIKYPEIRKKLKDFKERMAHK
jgi:5-(carboxyamino)imidazole ribonucleotide mutase